MTLNKAIIVPVDEVRAADDQGVGSRMEHNGEVFLWVLMSAGTDTPAIGDALGYVSSSYTGYTVSTEDSICIADWLAGAIQHTDQTTGYTAPADGEYFWMKVKGIHTSSGTPNTAGAGDAICLHAADGTFGQKAASEPDGGVYVATTTTLVLDCMDYVYAA